MNKREYQIQLLMQNIKEQEIKNKSIKLAFYKKMGVIKEENVTNSKTHEELIKESIYRIKNKRIFIQKETEEKIKNQQNE